LKDQHRKLLDGALKHELKQTDTNRFSNSVVCDLLQEEQHYQNVDEKGKKTIVMTIRFSHIKARGDHQDDQLCPDKRAPNSDKLEERVGKLGEAMLDFLTIEQAPEIESRSWGQFLFFLSQPSKTIKTKERCFWIDRFCAG
jgi:hypothetical protein